MVEVVGVTDSIKSTVDFLKQNSAPDLILMDIELADGQSFEVFNMVPVKNPVINLLYVHDLNFLFLLMYYSRSAGAPL